MRHCIASNSVVETIHEKTTPIVCGPPTRLGKSLPATKHAPRPSVSSPTGLRHAGSPASPASDSRRSQSSEPSTGSKDSAQSHRRGLPEHHGLPEHPGLARTCAIRTLHHLWSKRSSRSRIPGHLSNEIDGEAGQASKGV
ncbi:unnamed protein product [Somion occarium]|uniref:Uncharacterized protein n=1 Tax=Somion occarium TaxID=3059160 RepID=A0ABP1CTH3_9APHY